MINAERIVRTLDTNLDHEVALILYGRAAIALGFSDAPETVKHSLDVDVIIPMADTERFRTDLRFWDAQEATNRDLQQEGLYITHLFEAKEVFLRNDWEQHLVSIPLPGLRWLKLSRPATLDLILTKMMRGDDEQDMLDIEFFLRRESISTSELESAFAKGVIPDVVELHDAFQRAKPRVLKLAREVSSK